MSQSMFNSINRLATQLAKLEEAVKELEARIQAIENRPKPGRPKKDEK